MNFETMILERSDGIARLTFNRPDAANAISSRFAQDLDAATAAAEADESCHVLLIQANGKVFCAGGDVAEIGGAEDPSRLLAELGVPLNSALLRLRASRLLVIAAVQGAAAGAGLSLVLNADVVVAAESATFMAAFASVGLTPDSGLSRLLPLAVGPRRAIELCLGGRVLTAAEALEWGILTEVVPDAALKTRADERAAALAAGPTHVIGPTKALLSAVALEDYAAVLEREIASIAEAAMHPDTRARMAAFLARSNAKRS